MRRPIAAIDREPGRPRNDPCGVLDAPKKSEVDVIINMCDH